MVSLTKDDIKLIHSQIEDSMWLARKRNLKDLYESLSVVEEKLRRLCRVNEQLKLDF